MLMRPGVLRHNRSVQAVAASILKKYGGSLYIPSGATCFQDSAGSTPGAQDQPVGLMRDLVGTNHATQTTAGYKPILRKGRKNCAVNTSFTLGIVDGSPGTPPSYWNSTSPAAYGITRTIAHGTDIDGDYIELSYAGTNSSGAVQYPSGLVSHYLATPALPGCTVAVSAGYKLVAGTWPAGGATGRSWNIWENSAAGAYLTSKNLGAINTTLGEYTVLSGTKTLDNASTAYCQFVPLNLSIGIGATIDFTVRIYRPVITVGLVPAVWSSNTSLVSTSDGVGPYWLDFDGTDDRLVLGSIPFQQTDDQCVVGAGFVVGNTNNALFTVSSTTLANPLVAQLRNTGAGNTWAGSWRDDAGTLRNLIRGTVPGTLDCVALTQAGAIFRTMAKNSPFGTSENFALGATAACDGALIGAGYGPAVGALYKGGIYGLAVCKAIPTSAELRILEAAMSNPAGITLS